MISLNEANKKVAFDLFHLLSKEYPDENIMLSPVNLSAALSFLHYGSWYYKNSELEQLFQISKAKEHVTSAIKTLSGMTTTAPNLRRKQNIYLPTLSNAQAIAHETACEKEQQLSVTTSGEDAKQTDALALSVAKIIAQMDAEDEDSFSFIPWRKHLLGIENTENSTQEKLFPESEFSKNSARPCEDQEELFPDKNMAIIERNLSTASDSVDAAIENITALLSEFKQTMEQASDSVLVFKEASVTFKECCDSMCTSMSNLQGVLGMLIQILRE